MLQVLRWLAITLETATLGMVAAFILASARRRDWVSVTRLLSWFLFMSLVIKLVTERLGKDGLAWTTPVGLLATFLSVTGFAITEYRNRR